MMHKRGEQDLDHSSSTLLQRLHRQTLFSDFLLQAPYEIWKSIIPASLARSMCKSVRKALMEDEVGSKLRLKVLPVCDASIDDVVVGLRTMLQPNSTWRIVQLDFSARIIAPHMKSLSELLARCLFLKSLNIDHNSLSYLEFLDLCTGLKHCTMLSTLSLRGNKISTYPADDQQQHQTYVIEHCTPALTTFDLSFNHVGDDVFSEILNRMVTGPLLKVLNLSCNSIGNLGAQRLAGVLYRCPSLEYVNLHRNRIGNDGVHYLASSLVQCSRLTRLVVGSNPFFSMALEELLQALTQLSFFTTFEIRGWNGRVGERYSGQSFTSHSASYLAQCTALSSLDISFNYINYEDMPHLCTILSQCTALKILNLNSIHFVEDDDDLWDAAFVYFMCALRSCLGIQELYFRSSMFLEHSRNVPEAMSIALANMSSLAVLDLNDNLITCEDISMNSHHESFGTTLQELHLKCHDLELEGVRFLVDMLKACPLFRTLDLSTGRLSDDDIEVLFRGVCEMPTLAWLNLNNNNVGDDGAQSIQEALPQCTSLVFLNLGSNVMTDVGAKRLAAAIVRCTTLCELRLDQNNFTVTGDFSLRQAWRGGDASKLVL